MESKTISFDNKQVKILIDYDKCMAYLDSKNISTIYSKSEGTLSNFFSTALKNESINTIKNKTTHYNFYDIKRYCYKFSIDITKRLSKMLDSIIYGNDANSDNSLNNAFNYDIIKYDYTVDIYVSLDGSNVWVDIIELSILFNCPKSNITYHINSIIKKNRINKLTTIRKIKTTNSNLKVRSKTYYNLDIVMLLGSKIDIKKSQSFKKWALNILNEFKK